MKTTSDIHAMVDRIVAESRATDEPLAKRDDAIGVVARLRIAVCGAMLHAIADEGEMGTPPLTFAEGAECFLATIAGSLAGFLSGDPSKAQPNAATLLISAAETVMQKPDEMHGGISFERVKRGASQ